MDKQTKQGGPPAKGEDGTEERSIKDVQDIDPEKTAAAKAQSEYVPDSNNSMEKALGHGPK